MSISSRTPEGDAARCPVCGARVIVEPSQPTGDAPCPKCGHLLWEFQQHYGQLLGVTPERVTLDTLLTADDLGADSLDAVELIMDLEEEYEFSLSDDAASQIRTVGDAIRWIREHGRKRDAG